MNDAQIKHQCHPVSASDVLPMEREKELIYLLTFQQNASDAVPKERAKSYEKWTQSTVEHTGNFTPQHKLAAPTHVISSLHVLSRIQFYRNSNVITNAIRDASILARFSRVSFSCETIKAIRIPFCRCEESLLWNCAVRRFTTFRNILKQIEKLFSQWSEIRVVEN